MGSVCLTCENTKCQMNGDPFLKSCREYKSRSMTLSDKIVEVGNKIAIEDVIEENKVLKDKIKGFQRSRDKMRKLGFPTYNSVKEYAAELNNLKAENEEYKQRLDTYIKNYKELEAKANEALNRLKNLLAGVNGQLSQVVEDNLKLMRGSQA